MFRCFNILAAPVQMCIQICLRQDVSEEGKKAKTLSSKIEQELSEQAKNETRAVKILMLGAAESGKSTLVKQIKIIYRQGFSKAELLSFKPAVLDNLLKSMKFVLQGMGMLRINLAQKNNKEHAGFILSCNQCLGEDLEVLPFMAHAFFSLWADQGFRATTARGSEFDLNDSALYFFENLSRILAPNYIPTEMDVLKVRVRTCGIIETQFQVNRLVFRMYDLGSQTTERRKWLSCFDKVPIVLFVVALSDYDKTMIEDPAMNRLQESIKLFHSICANGVFSSSSLILFMNKMDLFRDKIQSSGRHLRLYLPSYTGADCDVDTASRHITAMLVACNTTLNKRVFHHFTSATDTSNIRMVFQVAMDTVVKQNLASVSLL